MSDRYRSVLLFGAPGVGKGTQGKRLGQENGFRHLASGDMFRALDKTSALGQKFLEHSSKGELVPDDLTVELWEAYVGELIEKGAYRPDEQTLLLDGIPRSVAQAEMLDAHIEPIGILHLAVPSIDDLVQRIKLRAEKEGRQDDADESVIRNRFDVYERHTAPVLRHYDPSLVRAVDALGTMDEVAARVRAAVEDL